MANQMGVQWCKDGSGGWVMRRFAIDIVLFKLSYCRLFSSASRWADVWQLRLGSGYTRLCSAPPLHDVATTLSIIVFSYTARLKSPAVAKIEGSNLVRSVIDTIQHPEVSCLPNISRKDRLGNKFSLDSATNMYIALSYCIV